MAKVCAPSYVEYLAHFLDNTEADLHDLVYYLKHHPLLNDFFEGSNRILYLVDYTRRAYAYFSKNAYSIIGSRTEEFLEGGTDYFLHIHHKDDLQVFSEKIFRNNLAFLKGIDPTLHSRYQFTYNYRVRRHDGSYAIILQQSKFIKSDVNRNPLFNFGTAIDITSFKCDNKISHSIDLIGDDGNAQNFLKDIYFPDPEAEKLSKREGEILKWILEGYNSQMIADKLFLSLHTVKTHRRNMLEKTNAKNTADLIRYGIKCGLV